MAAPGAGHPPGVHHAAPQEAIERSVALLDGLRHDGTPDRVWWHVTEPALVLGRGSPIRVDEEACRAKGIRIVRRRSGGGPVLWTEQVLALDVAVPRSHPLWSPDIVASYRWLGTALAQAVAAFVPDAHAVDPADARSLNDPTIAAQACYGGVSPWEVMSGVRKLVGLSQIRRSTGLLLQAGIVLVDQADVADLLMLDTPGRARLAEALTWPAPWPSVEPDRVRAAADDAVAQALDAANAAAPS